MDEIEFNNFNDYFQDKIYTHTIKFEKVRKRFKILVNFVVPLIVAFLFISPVPIFRFFDSIGNSIGYYNDDPFLVIFLFAIGYVIGYVYFSLNIFPKLYKNKVKKEILSKVLDYLNIKIGDINSEINTIKEYAASLHILPYFTKFKCDDYIYGEYKGIKLKIYHLILERYRKHGNNCVFNDILVSFENPIKQNTTIVVKNYLSSCDSLQEVQIEDPDFAYNVFSDNQIDSRNFFTPAILNKIDEWTKNNFPLYFSFEKDFVNIVIKNHSSDPFDPSDPFDVYFGKNPTDISNYTQIIQDIEKIFKAIDFLIEIERI